MADRTTETSRAEQAEFGGSADASARGGQRDDAGLRTRVRSFGADLRDRNLPLAVANRTVLLGVALVAGALSVFALSKARDRSREEQTFRARASKQVRRFQDAFKR